MIPRCLLPLVLVLLGAGPGMAKPWAKAMFKESSHDFGVVARGAKVEHRFVFENPYLEDVHIASVRTSCQCTSPSATKTLLKTYETAEIVAELNTRNFTGRREATITVVFDQPFPAEIQLHVYSFIRGDVVFEPGLVQFGSLGEGQGAQRRVTVTYAGRANWQILEIGSTVGYLEGRFKEVGRNLDPATRATQVTYDLEVNLKEDAPSGYFKEQLVLRTNDPNPQTARVPLTVEGLIAAPLTVNPSVLMLGAVRPNESVARNLVVRGQKPFRIVEVTGPDDRFRFTVADQARPVHVMEVRVAVGANLGKIAGKIRIKTDLAGATAEVGVDGDVVGPSANKAEVRPGPAEPAESGLSREPKAASRPNMDRG